MFLERLLKEPPRVRPNAVQLLQLRGWRVRELAELLISGRGQCVVSGAPMFPKTTCIW